MLEATGTVTIDTASDPGAWADALRFPPFTEHPPRGYPTADNASGCEGHPADSVTSGSAGGEALRLRMDGNGALSEQQRHKAWKNNNGSRALEAGRRLRASMAMPAERREKVHRAIVAAADVLELNPLDVVSGRRNKAFVHARWAVMLAMRHERGWPITRIAIALGLLDHTTVSHGLQQAPFMAERTPALAEAIRAARDAVAFAQ